MQDGGAWHEMKSWRTDHERRQLEALFEFVSSSCTLQLCDRLLNIWAKIHTPNTRTVSEFWRSPQKNFPAVLQGIQSNNSEIQSCFCSVWLRIQNQRWELNPSLRQQRVQATQSHGTGSSGSGTRPPERRKAIRHRLKTENMATFDYCSAVYLDSIQCMPHGY